MSEWKTTSVLAKGLSIEMKRILTLSDQQLFIFYCSGSMVQYSRPSPGRFCIVK